MEKQFTCIVCPNGCDLTIDLETMKVTGNHCKRGEKYAQDEITCPKRSITTTCKTVFEDEPVVSVRTTGDIPKELIFKAMVEINKTVIKERLNVGDVVIHDLLGTGVDVITTKKMEA